MLKERLDAMVREYRLSQRTSSKEIYDEAKLIWKTVEDIFLKAVRTDLKLKTNANRHVVEIGCYDNALLYSDDGYYIKYLSAKSEYSKEILEMLFEMARIEGILVIKKDAPVKRQLLHFCNLDDENFLMIQLYNFIYQESKKE